jgi:hypothetical protein
MGRRYFNGNCPHPSPVTRSFKESLVEESCSVDPHSVGVQDVRNYLRHNRRKPRTHRLDTKQCAVLPQWALEVCRCRNRFPRLGPETQFESGAASMITLNVNRNKIEIDVMPKMPLPSNPE